MADIDSDRAYLDQTPANQIEGSSSETAPVICEIQTIRLMPGTIQTVRTRQRGTHWMLGVLQESFAGVDPLIVLVGQGEHAAELPGVVALSNGGSARIPATSHLLTLRNVNAGSDPCYVTVMVTANAGEQYRPS